MLNIPNVIAEFIGIKSFPIIQEKVFCEHCERLRDGNEFQQRQLELASHGAHDGRVFIGYKIGHCLVVRISKGRDRGKWFILLDGGIICENNHFTGIRNSKIISSMHINQSENSPCIQRIGTTV